MTNQKIKAQLNAAARKKGLFVEVYSPGDGKTRYRFFELKGAYKDQDYFGPASGVYTALGAREAWAFLGERPARRRR